MRHNTLKINKDPPLAIATRISTMNCENFEFMYQNNSDLPGKSHCIMAKANYSVYVTG